MPFFILTEGCTGFNRTGVHMQPVQRLFFICLAFMATLGAALGVYLYVSLIPFFHEIGIAMTVLIILCIACVAYMVIVFTIARTGVWMSHRRQAARQERLLIAGDAVVLLAPDGTVLQHLSAVHEAAKIPRMLPAPKNEEGFSDDETVIYLYNTGPTYQTLMDAT